MVAREGREKTPGKEKEVDGWDQQSFLAKATQGHSHLAPLTELCGQDPETMTQAAQTYQVPPSMGFKSTCRWTGGRRKSFASCIASHLPPSFTQYSVIGFDGLGLEVKRA